MIRQFLTGVLIIWLAIGDEGGVRGDLSNVLKNYDTLHHSTLKHRIVKRSLDSNHPHVRQVEFSALGRNFHLYLQRKKGILSRDFKVVSVDGNDVEREVKLDLDAVYEGHLLDDPDSKINAIWEDGEDLIATIYTKDDLYMVEPSWRHLPKSKNHTMIVYRGSDVKPDPDKEKRSHCGFVHEDVDEAAFDQDVDKGNMWLQHQTDSESGGRQKRQAESKAFSFTPLKNTCHLLLVADYRFYRNMGQQSFLKTSSYLIGLIDRVDTIYRNTDFGHGYNGTGFEIKEMRIHTEPTVETNHYNKEQAHAWETRSLLEAFGSYDKGARYGHYCLAHLFTAQNFGGNVLGLSYIAEPVVNSPGGICSPVYYKGGQALYLNTGWSSSLNHYGRRLLTQEADLVTTHEFGHNWGSEHDPDTDECSKSAFDGGKYIMYTYSVSGYDPNNKIFSPCSKRSIGAVLRAKASGCFKERSKAFCGNNLVEEGEECDVGPDGSRDTDSCCTADCKFKPGAVCSTKNHDCCDEFCQFKEADTPCYEEGVGTEATCKQQATCPGDGFNCREPINAPNGTECLKDSMAKCYDGRCVPYCEYQGLMSCICDDMDNTCMFCCRDPKEENSTCEPQPLLKPIPLPDGMPCVQGYCNEGKCEKQVQDLVQRFFSIIEDISPDNIVEFMRANIVGTVIVLSLILWIPASCFVSYIDRKRRREEEEYLEWLRSDNQTLLLNKDKDKVKPATKTLQRRHPGTGSIIRQSMPASGAQSSII